MLELAVSQTSVRHQRSRRSPDHLWPKATVNDNGATLPLAMCSGVGAWSRSRRSGTPTTFSRAHARARVIGRCHDPTPPPERVGRGGAWIRALALGAANPLVVHLRIYDCVGITPSCCMKLNWSMQFQCSTILPSRTRMMSTNWSVTLFPVEGMPAKSPVCVPVKVFFVTT